MQEPVEAASGPRRGAAIANSFGLAEAFIGFFAGELFAAAVAAVVDRLAGHTTTFASDLAGLLGLWCGFVGAALFASFTHAPPGRRSLHQALREDYGFSLRPIDVPLGAAVGLACTFGLVPLMELPLRPFVSNLNQRISQPAHHLTANVNGAGYVVLALFICVGSPVVEELFFRGLLLRGALGWLSPRTGAAATPLALVTSGLLFGLAHFEPVELLALSALGVVLGVLAMRTGRLGPGIVAHATFNAVTIIALAPGH